MDKEVVFGHKISVNFRPRSDPDYSDSPPRDRNRDSNSSIISSSSNSPNSSRDSSLSPPRRSRKSKYMCDSQRKFSFPPPPVINNQNFPSLLKQGSPLNQSCPDSPFSGSNNMELLKERKSFAIEWSNSKSHKFPDVSAFAPFIRNGDPNVKNYTPRNIGRVSPFLMQDCDKKTSKNVPLALSDFSSNRRHTSNPNFPLYPNNSFHGMSQNISVPFGSIQRISDPVSFSQWNGTSSLPVESSHSLSRNCMTSDGLPVELHVSNLDPSFEVNEMKKTLLQVFSEHIMVLHISMSLQPDGSAKATVKVPTLQDAQYAISCLHRRKIGHKRIIISHLIPERSPPFHVLKSESVALLNDIPAKSLPLIKFRELYEKRYHRPIAVSELYKMRDAVCIQGDSGSRMVYLTVDFCRTPSVADSEDSQDYNVVEKPFCDRHFQVSDSQGWAEQYSICPLPIVYISLKTLSPAVHMLLDSHQGSIPLISFCDCYEAEIGCLPVVGNFENACSNDEDSDASQSSTNKAMRGVPLEHLIACVTGVEVAKSVLCIKKVQWLENKTQDFQISQNFSPALAGQLTLFGREVMDLLKSQSYCLVPFNKFIPTYHHHFGRQCRVADYGFTKLIDLLEAIPHIVQVLGEGQNRQVTLTHRTQVKRFSAELLRILKSRASKQITVSEFSQAYEQVVEKSFEITNYGVCEIGDMLDEVPDSAVVICESGNEMIIAIPKREQTPEEIQRTKEFSNEVIELMRHTPCCSMSFNKFIPAYHHHFGKQCRVADYGFTKLIELFEAIPFVLEVTGTGEDKVLILVTKEQHKILTQRLVSILKTQPNEVIDINQISSVYARIHGHALRVADFGFPDLHELLESMDSVLRIVIGYGRTYVSLVDYGMVHQISLNLRRLLMEQADGKMLVTEICKTYQTRFGQKINLSLYLPDMTNLIKVEGDYVQLTPLQLVARDIILLLQDYESQIPLPIFGSMFQQRYNVPICTANFGFQNMYSMLEDLSDYFSVKGKKQKRIVCLNLDNISTPLPAHNVNKVKPFPINMEQKNILNEPIPSALPSPSLEPSSKGNLKDLMGFETPPYQGSPYVSEHSRRIKKQESSEFSIHIPESQAQIIQPHEVHKCTCPIASSSEASSMSATYFHNLSQSSQITSSPHEQFKKSMSVIEPSDCRLVKIAHLESSRVDTDCRKSVTSLCSSDSSTSQSSYNYVNEQLNSVTDNEDNKSKGLPRKICSRKNRIAAQFTCSIND